MKMKKTELIVLAVTLAFGFFTGGYLLGRAQPAGVSEARDAPVVITAQSGTESPALPEKQPDSAVSDSPAPVAESPAESAPALLYGKININTATSAELTDLPGIGPALADRILQYREQNGNFQSIEDIIKVSGIGEKKLEAMREHITVE